MMDRSLEFWTMTLHLQVVVQTSCRPSPFLCRTLWRRDIRRIHLSLTTDSDQSFYRRPPCSARTTVFSSRKITNWPGGNHDDEQKLG